MGAFLAIFAATAFAFRLFVGKWLVNKRSDPIFLSFAFQIVVAIIYIPFLFFEQIILPIDINIWFLWLINMFLYLIFTISNYYMNIHMDISLSSILGQTKTIVTFIGALIIFNETAGTNKIIGVILIILGNIILFVKKGGYKEGISKKGLLFLTINTLSLALTSFFDATLIEHFSVNAYGMLGYLAPAILTVPILMNKMSMDEFKDELRSNLKTIFIMSITAPLSYSALLYAYTISPKSVVYPLGNISTLVLVFLGVVFLKERKMLLRKVIAAIIVILGAILLTI